MKRPLPLPAAAVAAALATLLAGCAAGGPVAWYGGAMHAREDDAVLSPVGGDLQRNFRVVLIELDGRAVDAASIDELRLGPGPHAFQARVKFGSYPAGPLLYWQEARIRVSFAAQRGHTYLPNALLASGAVLGNVADMGEDYPADCLPAARGGFRRLAPRTREADEACLPRR